MTVELEMYMLFPLLGWNFYLDPYINAGVLLLGGLQYIFTLISHFEQNVLLKNPKRHRVITCI